MTTTTDKTNTAAAVTTTTRMGRLWMDQEAAEAFAAGEIRSCMDYTGGRSLRLCIRNQSNEPHMLLCWVDETGQPHHFYHLKPKLSSSAAEDNHNRDNDKDGLAKNMGLIGSGDHVERTSEGHAFVVATAPSQRALALAQKSGSLQTCRVVGAYQPGAAFALPQSSSSLSKASASNGNDDDMANDDFHAQMWILSQQQQQQQNEDETAQLRQRSLTGSNNDNHNHKDDPNDVYYDDNDITECFGSRRRSASCCFPFFGHSKQQHQNRHQQPATTTHAFKRLPVNSADSAATQNGATSRSAVQQQQEKQPQDNLMAWYATVIWATIDKTPFDTSKKVYHDVMLGGNDDEYCWPCKVEPNWYGNDLRLRDRVEDDLRCAVACLPKSARQALLLKTPTSASASSSDSPITTLPYIWINKSLKYGPAACPVTARGACFHPDVNWLLENGMTPAKAKCIEFYDMEYYKESGPAWGKGGTFLHELSHAYHNRVLPDGYDNADIIQCYKAAMKDGLYDCVHYHGGETPCRAYAAQNHMEYWAELSTAFLGGTDPTVEYNKWFPYNRQQVQQHDPRMYQLLQKLWNVRCDNGDNNNNKH